MCKCKPDYEADYCVDCSPVFIDRETYNAMIAENAELKAKVADEAEKTAYWQALQEQTQAKLAEWMDTLGGYGDNPENVLNWIQGATTRCLLSEEYERQIKDGDMFTMDTVATWLRQNTHYGRARDIACSGLKQYAAERQEEPTPS